MKAFCPVQKLSDHIVMLAFVPEDAETWDEDQPGAGLVTFCLRDKCLLNVKKGEEFKFTDEMHDKALSAALDA